MQILSFAGSLRQDSLNKKLSRYIVHAGLSPASVSMVFCDLQTLHIPVYDGDIEAQGMPEGVQKLVSLVQASKALIVCTPEYNGSIPGVLKNALDWISRTKPNPLSGKHVLLLAASPGALGGVRSLWHSRQPFDALECHVYPKMVGVSKAHVVLAEEGQVADEKIKSQIDQLVREFIAFVEANHSTI